MKKTSTRSISFIGSGNVATHLALAFHAAGHTIRQVFSREFDHAALLASRVGAQPIDKIARLALDADVYILAVNDDALYDVALDLNERRSSLSTLHAPLLVHTSGSTPASVLKPVSRRYGVVWSPQTFLRDIAMDYRHLPLCIEGCNPQVEADIEELAARLKDNGGIALSFSPEAVDKLAEEGFDPVYGARPLRRTIQSRVEDAAAELMLDGTLRAGDCVQVDAGDGAVTVAKKAG